MTDDTEVTQLPLGRYTIAVEYFAPDGERQVTAFSLMTKDNPEFSVSYQHEVLHAEHDVAVRRMSDREVKFEITGQLINGVKETGDD